MNGGLVLEEQIKLRLGDGVTFDVDFKTMRGLYRPFSRWIDGPFERAVLRFVDRGQQVEVAFPVFLLPVGFDERQCRASSKYYSSLTLAILGTTELPSACTQGLG